MDKDLSNDVELMRLVNEEEDRQKRGIELIASENFAPQGVLDCLGSILTNKYSEGQPGRRYYGGNEVIDKVECLAKSRALKAFNLDPEKWHVNVQPYSGSPANFAVYTALLQPHDRIMGLDLPSGGHLTHGFSLPNGKRVSATSLYFESMPYQVYQSGEKAGLIDYDDLEVSACKFRPRLIICGASAYPRDIDYKRFREIADKCRAGGAILMADMSHISGFVATGLMSNPFDYCDVVTTTTHKTLGGPRSGMIFVRRDKCPDWSRMIDEAVFPGLQGGPHNHQIAGVAYQLGEVCKPEFRDYMVRVRDNARCLAEELMRRGVEVSTDGTDNHIVLVKLSKKGITGSKLEKVCEMVDISVNKNTVPGDTNPMNPSGVRLGTSAMTTRGCGVDEMLRIADFLMRAIDITINAQNKYGVKLVNFLCGLETDNELKMTIKKLKTDINNFAVNLRWY